MGTRKFREIVQINYERAIEVIQTGDLLFCSGSYLISEFIKKVSQSDMSHVAFLFKWNGRVLVFESVEQAGVRIIPLLHYVSNYDNSGKKYKGSLYIARHEKLIDSAYDEALLSPMLGKGIDSLNQQYAQAEIMRILTRIQLGIGQRKNQNEFICSEFVDQCFQQIGIQFARSEGGFIYPEHIAADQRVFPLFELVV